MCIFAQKFIFNVNNNHSKTRRFIPTKGFFIMEHITDQNYQEVVAKGLPLVLDFSATWCGPCKKVAPIMDEIAEEYAGKVIVGKCDVDECEDLAMEYGIRNVPTVLYIKDGAVVDKQVGAATKSVFVEKLQAIL